MEKKDPKIIKLEKEFSSLDSEGIIRLIESLRDEKSFSGGIGLLADLYTKTTESIIRAVIEKFFYDLKDQNLAVEVISAIEESADEDTRNVLLSSCWQSHIDYSGYIEFFINLSIDGSYLNALECLTIIEQSAESLTEDIRNNGVKKISAALRSIEGEKQSLLREIISILID